MQNGFRQNISNEEIAELPTGRFEGRIVVVQDKAALRAACADLSRHGEIGFDTETRPSFRAGEVNRTALVQLSTPEVCYLVRLCRTPVERCLIKLFENTAVKKIGADVKGDLRALQQLRRFRAAGFEDLQDMGSRWGVMEKSVRKMAAIVLGVRVSKAQRLSNWEAAELTPAQQMYAATDAWICLEMYRKLLKTTPHVPQDRT